MKPEDRARAAKMYYDQKPGSLRKEVTSLRKQVDDLRLLLFNFVSDVDGALAALDKRLPKNAEETDSE
jgi:hypothetical protein